MPRFAASVTMMFNEWDLLDRFEQAAGAGFDGVEIQAPYGHAGGAGLGPVVRHRRALIASGVTMIVLCRGVAQPGRALGSGPRGRRFKSSRPDHFLPASRTDLP